MNRHSAEFEQSREKIANNMRGLVEGAEALLRTTASYTGDEVEAARGKLNEQLSRAHSLYSDLESSAVDSYRNAATHTEAYVKANPWRSVGIAAGIGALISLLVARR